MDVVNEYSDRYHFDDERDDFFIRFIEEFPNSEIFQDTLWDYVDEPDIEDEYEDHYDEDGGLWTTKDNYELNLQLGDMGVIRDEDKTPSITMNDVWSPESEVYMLGSILNSYPGDGIWMDFRNDLINVGW